MSACRLAGVYVFQYHNDPKPTANALGILSELMESGMLKSTDRFELIIQFLLESI